MVVKELRAGRLHDRRRNTGCGRFTNYGGKFGDAFPVAVIIEETARFTGGDDVSGVWSRLTLVARYAFGDRFDQSLNAPRRQIAPSRWKVATSSFETKEVTDWFIMAPL